MSRSSISLANKALAASDQQTRTDSEGVSYLEHFQHVIPTGIGAVPLPLAAYLVDTSNSDSVEMAVDGTTDKNFDLVPASDATYRVSSLTLVAHCSSQPAVNLFGNITALTTGCSLLVIDEDDATITDLLGGQTLKSNLDLAAFGEFLSHTIGSTYMVRTQINFPQPVRIIGSSSEKLRAIVADNLSSITRLRCFVRGTTEAFE